MARIIILEDDPTQSLYLMTILERAGHTIVGTYSSGEEAVSVNEQDGEAQLILADTLLSGEMDGAEAVRRLQQRLGIPAIFLTAHSDNEHLIRLCERQPAAILLKPCRREELLAAIDLALGIQQREEQQRAAELQTMDSLAQGNVRAIMLTDALTRLLGEALDNQSDMESFVSRLLDELCVLVNSRYAAFATLEQKGMTTFISRGIDPKTRESIGRPPRGKGVLRTLYQEGKTIHIPDVTAHPAFSGFPPHHPPLGPLLGVPVQVEGRQVGLIYLAREPGAPAFQQTESELVRLFAIQAGHLLQRERLHRDLRRTHDRLHTLLADSPVVIFELDRRHPLHLNYVSENAERILGIPPHAFSSGDWLEHIHREDQDRIRALLEDACCTGLLAGRFRFLGQDDRLRWIEIRAHHRSQGEESRLVGIMQDVSEEKKVRDALEHSHNQLKRAYQELREAQDQALQSEKLASIGQLAAGVAHEINNPLGYIGSNLSSLKQDINDLFQLVESYRKTLSNLPLDQESKKRLTELEEELDLDYLRKDLPQLIEESQEGVDRARIIVRDLKDFSRAGDGRFTLTDLHQGLESTLNIAHNQIKYKAEIIKDYDPDLPEIVCIPSQINQVVLNLLVNAAQAISDKGTITLRTRHDHATVTIEVSDTGCGIPPEIKNRIFDPFFTTKPQGQGTGLGLSLSYGIIQRHHGRIEVESSPGEGTTFRIVLPRHTAQPQEVASETPYSSGR